LVPLLQPPVSLPTMRQSAPRSRVVRPNEIVLSRLPEMPLPSSEPKRKASEGVAHRPSAAATAQAKAGVRGRRRGAAARAKGAS
jgi:hypothetical protein